MTFGIFGQSRFNRYVECRLAALHLLTRNLNIANHRSKRSLEGLDFDGTTVFSVKLDMYSMLKSVTGEFLQRDSYFIFRRLVLFVWEFFLMSIVFVYPCEKMASLVDIGNVKLDSISCLVAFHIPHFRSLSNGDMRRHGLLIFDMMFVFAVNRTRKPDVNIVFLRVCFNFLKCDSILPLDCFNGGIFICLTPNGHHTILPIRDIECNSNIILRFIASHLFGSGGNIANDRSKRSLICDI